MRFGKVVVFSMLFLTGLLASMWGGVFGALLSSIIIYLIFFKKYTH